MKKILIKAAYFLLLCICVFAVGYVSTGSLIVAQWTKDARDVLVYA